jgi:hypothetical protein
LAGVGQGNSLSFSRRHVGAAGLSHENDETVRRWDRHDPMSLAAALVGIGSSQPFHHIDDLAAIDVPALVIPGSDPLHDPNLADEYVHSMPRGVLGREGPTAIADFIATI